MISINSKKVVSWFDCVIPLHYVLPMDVCHWIKAIIDNSIILKIHILLSSRIHNMNLLWCNHIIAMAITNNKWFSQGFVNYWGESSSFLPFIQRMECNGCEEINLKCMSGYIMSAVSNRRSIHQLGTVLISWHI